MDVLVDGFVWVTRPPLPTLLSLCDEVLLLIMREWYPSPNWPWVCRRLRYIAHLHCTPLQPKHFRCHYVITDAQSKVGISDCIWHLDITIPTTTRFVRVDEETPDSLRMFKGGRDLRTLRYRSPGRFFSARDAQSLGRLVEQNVHIRALHLSLAHCSMRGNTLMFTSFFGHLFGLGHLRQNMVALTLCLNDNMLFHCGAHVLRALRRFDALRSMFLDLRHCGLGDADIEHICDGPFRAPRVRSVVILLGNNHVTDEGVMTLASCLLRGTIGAESLQLIHVSLCLNDIGRYGVSIAEHIQKSRPNSVRIDLHPQRSMVNRDWTDD